MIKIALASNERELFLSIIDGTVYMLYIIDMGMTARQVMKILKKNGWKLARINSSHHIFVKKGYDRPVPVPFHKGKDDNLGDFAIDILKEANIDPKTLKEIQK